MNVAGPGASTRRPFMDPRRVLPILLLAGTFALVSLSGTIFSPIFGDSSAILRGSGIGMAALLVYGRKLWPGILLGAVVGGLISGYLTGSWQSSDRLLLTVLVISVAATAQALVGATLIRRVGGFPIRLQGPGQFALLALCIPVACVVLPTTDLGLAAIADWAPASSLVRRWLAWWIGDMIGVGAAIPVILLAPWHAAPLIYWRGQRLARFTYPAIAYLVLAFGVTIAAWSLINQINQRQNATEFSSLANDNRRALVHRLESYDFGLEGVASLFSTGRHVTRLDLQRYVATLGLVDHLPGISGIGYIQPVQPDKIDTFLAQARLDGVPDLVIREANTDRELFVIKYIEPLAPNAAALGLNIAYEPNRRDAAIVARDSGASSITHLIKLVQDSDHRPAFLVLMPIYGLATDTNTVEQRRAAFLGWIYAPFVGAKLLDNLTVLQGRSFTLSVYDGAAVAPDRLIYSDADLSSGNRAPRYQMTESLPVFGKTWTLVWTSTHAFEVSGNIVGAPYVLFVGLSFTLLLGIFLQSLSQREERIRETVALRTRELATQVDENRSIVTTAIAMIAILDSQARIVTVNDATTRLFGISRDELIGKPFASLFGGAMSEYFSQPDDPSSAIIYRGEMETTSAAGARLVLDIQASAWKTSAGDRRFTVIMRNISDKRLVEDQLRMTQRRLDVALTGARIGFYDIDLRTGESVVSPSWKEIFGYDRDEVLDSQREWRSRLHPDDMPVVDAADRACIEGRSDRSISEYRIRFPNDKWRWFRSDAVGADRGGDGVATRLVGVLTDIDDTVRAKEELRDSEELFRSAIDYAPVGMALVNLNGRFARVNAALAAMADLSQADLLQRDFRTLVHDDEVDRLLGSIESLLSGEQISFQTEMRFQRADHSAIWGLIGVALVRDGKGKPVNFVVEIQDISDKKRVEELKDQFVSTVSHELRTPLTSINGSLSILLNVMANDIPDAGRRMLSIAQKNCNRLILLVNDILDLEKFSSGQVVFDLKHADVTALVARSVADNQPMADKFSVALVLPEDTPQFMARVDENRFQQVMANLLSNAAKFSQRGGTVQVRVEKAGTNVRISVADNGRGIPASFRDKIFTPFSQADGSSNRDTEGTGLGLNIARQIIGRMGGTIGYDSDPGVKTTFWFELPILPPDA